MRDVVAGLQRPAHRQTEVVDQHEVVLHAAVLVAQDAIEDLDDGADPDDEAGLLDQFAGDALLERFADLEFPAGNAPPQRQRLVLALDEDHVVAVDDDAADADNGTSWIGAIRHDASGTAYLT